MRFNAHHGLYRMYRELEKILIRKINATCEIKLTPERKFKHVSYRHQNKKARMYKMRTGINAMYCILFTGKKGGKNECN